MKLLITGIAGFQGSHLAKRLYKDGYVVFGLNTYSPRSEKNLEVMFGEDYNRKIKIHWGSITDEEIVEKTIRNADLVYHLAARINVDESREDPEAHIKCNILGTYNILKYCQRYNIPLIYGSSCECYGSKIKGILMDENHPLNPRSPYAASKVGADRLCYSFYHTYKNMKMVIVRPSNVFGWGQKYGKGGAVIPTFTSLALEDKDLTIFGDGKQTRDFLYIDDLVEAYIRVKNNMNRLDGEVINLGAGPVKIIDIASLIIKYTRSKSRVNHLTARPGEVERFEINYDKAKKYLGWKPKNNFSEGLQKYIRMVIKYGL